MEIITEKDKMRNWTRRRKRAGDRVAFVPTMGSLHEGHLSLVKEAKARAERVVVSVYVNPGQFSPGEDFSIYPRDFKADLEKLQPFQVDVVFNPYDLYIRDEPVDEGHSQNRRDEKELEKMKETVHIEGGKKNGEALSLISGDEFGTGHETWIRVERLEKPLCGQSRPAFFRGVATVVAKLFNIIEPDVAVFGRKDFQQWRLICKMVQDLDFDIEIVGAPLMREPDGLAMSSRNVRLSADERKRALSINKSFKDVEAAIKSGVTDAAILTKIVHNAITEASGSVDYIEMVDRDTLRPMTILKTPAVIAVAANFGSVRLLDNTELQPIIREDVILLANMF